MKKIKFFLRVVAFLSIIPYYVSAQTDSEIRDYLVSGDFVGLAKYYSVNNNVEERKEIEDIFDCFVDWQAMTYEQVLDLNAHIKSINIPLKALLKRVIMQKESLIVEEASELTAEQLCVYLANYPKRNEVIEAYINNVLNICLDSLSYDEYLYLQENFKENGLLKRQEGKRKDEGFDHMKNAVETYCKLENSYTNRLLFILKYRAWQYLVSRHKTAVKYYSKVGIVADNSYGVTSQYEGIIHSCFSAEDLNRQLTNDLTAFVKAINNARARYAGLAGLAGNFPRAVVKLPSIGGFPIKSNMKIANRIPEAREEFISSRQTVGTIANFASLFVGEVVSSIGQGLFDIHAVNELAEKEYNARRDYIADVCKQLERIFRDYYNILNKSIQKQMSDNQKIFSNYVKQH